MTVEGKECTMIDNCNKYIAATPPNDILIDGGIMPARDVAGDGSWKILRGEDPCFLLEAARRIYAYTFSDDGYDYDVTKKVAGAPIRAAIDGIHHGTVQDGANYKTWPHRPVLVNGSYSGTGWRYIPDVVSYGTSGTANYWDGCLTAATRSAASDFKASRSDFFTGRALIADNIRKIFYDLNRVKGVVATEGETTYSADSTYQERAWYPDGTQYRDVTYPTNERSRVISMEMNSYFFGPVQYDYKWEATGIDNPMTHPEHLAALTPTSCWTLWIVKSSLRTSTTDRYVDAYIVDSAITSGGDISFGIPVASSDILSLCVRAHGLYDYVWDMPEDGIEEIYATCTGVMFYDEGIDFSSIGWVWPPAP